MKQIPPIEVKPSAGGRLMGGLSYEAPGIQNYVTKRDWRRFYDKEIRAEGHDGMVLSQAVSASIQITPDGSDGPLTLICQATRGDGKRTIVAGNPTTLWAYTGTEDTHYASSDYFANDGGAYVDEIQYGWIEIASGLSSAGRRWEAVPCGDYIVLNNGVDLPLTYRPGEMVAKPIYELREQQVARVGTIASHGGILLCMDLYQISDTAFADLMAPTVINDDGTFTPNPNQYAAVTDPTLVQRYPWRVLPSMQAQPRRFGAIVPVAAALGDFTLQLKYPIRSLPELVLANQAGGRQSGNIGGATDAQVLYAGTAGNTLNASIVACSPDITMTVTIREAVGNPVAYFNDDYTSYMEASDAANSYAGAYTDLADSGSAIVKALQLLDNIIIYKETPEVYIGTFTGSTTNPYQFQRVVFTNAGTALKYRNTLVAAGGGGFYSNAHIYAGERAFYKFDLFNRNPTEIPELQPCQELFFQAASADPENAFAAENPLTREWNLCWAANPDFEDTALVLDYAFRTVRTTSADIRAAGKCQHPAAGRNDWLFLFGDSDGSVQRYGLWSAPAEKKAATINFASGKATVSTAIFTVDHVGKTIVLPSGAAAGITSYISSTQVGINVSSSASAASFVILPGIWHRNGQIYASVLETGAGDLGTGDNEKVITRYIPVSASTSQNANLNIAWKAGQNPATVQQVMATTLTSPAIGPNLLEPTFMGTYVGVTLTVSGLNAQFDLVNQIWQPVLTNSRSAGRI